MLASSDRLNLTSLTFNENKLLKPQPRVLIGICVGGSTFLCSYI